MVADGLSEACVIGRGVRQGCSLSPLLYIIYDEAMIRDVSRDCDIGIKVGGKIVNMIRYADDKAVVASSQKGLQELMTRLNKVTRDYGMKINVKKTKTMCISRKGKGKVHLQIDGGNVLQGNQFKYLGSWITDDGYCANDVRARIAMGKAVFMEKKKLLTGKLDCELKKRIIMSTVWNVALYAAETWALTKASRKLVEAFEMWIWRRMLEDQLERQGDKLGGVEASR